MSDALDASHERLASELTRQRQEIERERIVANQRWNHPNRIVRWLWRLWMTTEVV